MFRRKGPLQWPASRMNPWPERPAQWVLLVIGAVATLAFLYAVVKLGSDLAAFLLVNLVWYASMLMMSLLYRRLSRRQPT